MKRRRPGAIPGAFASAAVLAISLAGCPAREARLQPPGPPLAGFLAGLHIPGAGSGGFRVPGEAEPDGFRDGMAALLGGRAAEAAARLAPRGYRVQHLQDGYLAASEPGPAGRGQGSYVVAPTYRLNLVLEVPHPLFDQGTLAQAQQLLRVTGARALFVAGAHRCAAGAPTPCAAGRTATCGGTYRVSDAAHYTGGFFQAAHAATLRLPRPPLALSLHAFLQDADDPPAILSDGTRAPAPPAAAVVRLQAALAAAGLAVASCNDGKPWPPHWRRLCGTGNVQGRLSNGAADACQQEATRASGLFLHLEQGPALLAHPEPLAHALQQVLED